MSFNLESSPNHVILMIIDALRVDYVFNKNNSYYLKSVEKLEEEGKAFLIKLRTHTPTVTLPRLKVMIYL
jgi:predicted AlkP superfamily pyrophosphatase or phosphodiesterase